MMPHPQLLVKVKPGATVTVVADVDLDGSGSTETEIGQAVVDGDGNVEKLLPPVRRFQKERLLFQRRR